MKNLREYLALLASKGELREISEPCDPRLEIPEIHRRVVEKRGPALLFRHPIGSDFPLVTNLFGTPERIRWAFGSKPEEFVRDAVRVVSEMGSGLGALWEARGWAWKALRVGLKDTKRGPITECGPENPALQRLPATVSWPGDGGPFLTLPLVYTEHPESGKHNLGIYRMQTFSDAEAGMHWQIHKGGGFHYHEAEKRKQALPVAVFLGGPPALIFAAIAPLPEDVPELLLASLLLGEKLERVRVRDFPLPLVAEAEFALLGEIAPGERRPEGPFGDHYGYYSLRHDFPVFRARSLYRRRDAIACATVVGAPPQEDLYIGDYLQELLSPLFPLVMPSVRRLAAYGETGFHPLVAAEVKVRYPREAFASGLRILGESQLTLTKVLLLVDSPVPFRPFCGLLEHLLRRSDFACDLRIFAATSMDTLDYAGPRLNEGSKMLWMAVGPERYPLTDAAPGNLPVGARKARAFCPGCLVIEGPSYAADQEFPIRLAGSPELTPWRMVVLVDDIEEVMASEMAFLWAVFTRFNPASDIHPKSARLVQHQPVFETPLVWDARIKPWYPEKLTADPGVSKLVDQKWPRLQIG